MLRPSTALSAALLAALSVPLAAQNHHLFTLDGDPLARFGDEVLLAPAIDADDLADTLVGLPSDGGGAGTVIAYAGKDRREEWSASGAAGDGFGASLAVGDDYNGDGIDEILVGAPQAGCAGPGYVAILDGASGAEWDRIGGTQTCDAFGAAVCSMPDLDGDSLAEIVVGAPGVAGGAGSVFVFSVADLSSPHLAMPVIPGSGAVGSALCAFDDANGDSIPDLLVGAPLSSFTGPSSGAAVVLSGADLSLVRGWLGNAGDYFGTSVASLGDANGDGLPDAAVGAPQGDGVTDPSVSGNGLVRILSPVDGIALDQLSGDSFGELFGFALAGVGDVDGDGLGDVAVGSPWHPFAAAKAGCVQIVSVALDSQLLVEFGDGTTAEFGRSLSSGQDVNEDGVTDVALGIPGSGKTRVLSSRHLEFQTDIHLASIAAGATMTCDIDVGPGLAGFAYYFLGSAAGQEPGFPIFNMHMPLVWDWYFCETAIYPNTPPFINTLGSLDAEGRATCKWQIGPGAVSPIGIGLYLEHLVMVFNPGFDLLPVKVISNIEPLTLVN